MSCERELIQVAKGGEERAAKPGFSPWVLKEKLRAGLAWWALDWLNYFPSPEKFLMFSFVTSYNPRIVLWYGKGKCVEPQAGDRAFCASVYKSLCDGSRNRTQWPRLPLSPINNYCIFVVQDDGFHYDFFCPHIACKQTCGRRNPELRHFILMGAFRSVAGVTTDGQPCYLWRPTWAWSSLMTPTTLMYWCWQSPLTTKTKVSITGPDLQFENSSAVFWECLGLKLYWWCAWPMALVRHSVPEATDSRSSGVWVTLESAESITDCGQLFSCFASGD